jgi:hypothetical protein
MISRGRKRGAFGLGEATVLIPNRGGLHHPYERRAP